MSIDKVTTRESRDEERIKGRVDTMNHRERFLATINHQKPDRIPVDVMAFQKGVLEGMMGPLGVDSGGPGVDSVEEIYRRLRLDFRDILPPSYTGPLPKEDPAGSNVGYWGVVDVVPSETEAHSMPYGDSLTLRPLQKASSLREVEEYLWPDPTAFDYGVFVDKCKKNQEFVVRSGGGPLFCQVCSLAGMETTLRNLLLQPRIVEAIVERITEFNCEAYRGYFVKASEFIDVFRFWDDVATDRGLFFNLRLWRKFFKKPLAKIFAVAKDFGLRIQYHCCGAMSELIPDLLEVGMDILEPCQFHLPGMEPKRLKREFGRDLTFWGGINTQQTLPFGTTEQVREEVRERIDIVGKNGGYILSSDHSLELDVPVKNILAMYEEAGNRTKNG